MNKKYVPDKINLSAFELGKEYDVSRLNLGYDVKGLKFVLSKTTVRFICRFTFNGIKISKSLGSCLKDDIKAKVYELVPLVESFHQLIAKGVHPFAEPSGNSNKQTIAYFAKKVYLPNAKSRKKSYCNDETRLRIHVLPVLGKLRFEEISVGIVSKFLANLTSKGLSNATINRVRALLSSIFNLAIDHEIIVSNPISRIKKYREDNQKERYLNDSELKRLMKVLNHPSDFGIENLVIVAAVKFLLLTGVRKREALDLKFTDVDIETGSWLLGENKSGKARRIHLNADALSIVKMMSRQYPYVFANPQTGLPFNDIRKCFDKIMHAADIQDMRIHDLRHNFASLAVNSGESLYVVQHLLGHASPQTTQRYAHLQSDTLREASQHVADKIRQSVA